MATHCNMKFMSMVLNVFKSGLAKNKVLFSRIKRKVLVHVWPVRLFLILILVGAVYLTYLISGLVLNRISSSFYGNLAKQFITADESTVKRVNDRTNILILGKGGGSHEAPDLTDTIIFVSLSHKDNTITMISLPRDIWVTDLRAKLNSTYYYGENLQQFEGGLILAKTTVEKLINQPVQYALVIDFTGFKELIDTVGGIDVNVSSAFTDDWFPIEGRENDMCQGDPDFRCRYETINFSSGIKHMDGVEALKYVRSRHAEGDAGTDVAREMRQQEVVTALKSKFTDPQILASREKVQALMKIVEENIDTDIETSTANALVKIAYKSRNAIFSYVLPQELLANPPYSAKYDFQYVFIPKTKDWRDVQDWVLCVIENKNCDYLVDK